MLKESNFVKKDCMYFISLLTKIYINIMQRNPMVGFIENLCKMFFQMPSCTYIWLTLSLLHTGKAYDMTKMTAKKNLAKKNKL